MQAHKINIPEVAFEEQYEQLLSELTAFNPALVYGLIPEVSIKENLDFFNASQHFLGQQFDALSAYLHAQKMLLPQIKKHGIKFISAEFILEALNELHKKIAKTIAEDYGDEGVLNGVYTSQYAMRYKQQKLKILLDSFFNKKSSYEEFIGEVATFGKESKVFVDLMTCTVAASRQVPGYNNNQDVSDEYKFAFDMLIDAYHKDKLTEDEKRNIQQCLTICTPPEKISKAMRDYAQWLANELQSIDAKNLGDVSVLLAGVFQKLIAIHPYFKANGRLAACWINLLLVAFDYPSILLEYPEERKDPASAYSKVIRYVESNPNEVNVLAKHIASRIEASLEKEFSHPNLDRLIRLRMQVLNLLKKCTKKHSLEELKNYFVEKMKIILDELTRLQKKVDKDVFMNEEIIKYLTQYLTPEQTEKNKTIFYVGSFHQKKYDAVYKSNLIEALKKFFSLHQSSECKLFDNKQDKGLICHVKFSERNDALAMKDQIQLFLKNKPELNQLLLLNEKLLVPPGQKNEDSPDAYYLVLTISEPDKLSQIILALDLQFYSLQVN